MKRNKLIKTLLFTFYGYRVYIEVPQNVRHDVLQRYKDYTTEEKKRIIEEYKEEQVTRLVFMNRYKLRPWWKFW